MNKPARSQEVQRTHEDLEIKDASLIFKTVMNDLESEFGKTNLVFPKEIIWLGGAPGAGKGTNTDFIMQERGFTAPPVVISSLLDSDEAKSIKDAGGMVGDKEVTDLLFRELLKPVYQTGAIVDGFPRTKVQVECLKMLYNSLVELHDQFHNTPIGDSFRYPIFRICVLFVEEKVSVERQLSRGLKIKEENEQRQEEGLEPLEQRKTDFSAELAKNRYRVFKEQTFDALQSLKQKFHYHYIDADKSLEEVQWDISKEFQYQSSLELDHQVFELVRSIPLAKELVIHARQELVKRIENYVDHHLELFRKIIEFIEKRIIPIVHRHAISGHAQINTEDVLFEEPLAVAMLVDIFSDRGYHVVVDVKEQYVPDRVDLETGQITCRRKKLLSIDVKFTGSDIRRG